MEEEDIQAGRGRPKGRNKTGLDISQVLPSPRRPGSSVLDHAGPAHEDSSVGNPAGESLLLSSPALKPGQVSHYSKKENFYLLGSSVDKFPMSKLPKHNVILRRFLAILREHTEVNQESRTGCILQESSQANSSRDQTCLELPFWSQNDLWKRNSR